MEVFKMVVKVVFKGRHTSKTRYVLFRVSANQAAQNLLQSLVMSSQAVTYPLDQSPANMVVRLNFDESHLDWVSQLIIIDLLDRAVADMFPQVVADWCRNQNLHYVWQLLSLSTQQLVLLGLHDACLNEITKCLRDRYQRGLYKLQLSGYDPRPLYLGMNVRPFLGACQSAQ